MTSASAITGAGFFKPYKSVDVLRGVDFAVKKAAFSFC